MNGRHAQNGAAKLAALLLVLLGTFGIHAAYAAAFIDAGTLYAVDSDDGLLPLPDNPDVLESYVVRFFYDPTTADTDADPHVRRYTGAITGLSISVNPQNQPISITTLGPAQITGTIEVEAGVFDPTLRRDVDRFTLTAQTTASSDSPALFFQISMFRVANGRFASDSLEQPQREFFDNPNGLTLWENEAFELHARLGSLEDSALGSVESLSYVPLPPAIWLLGSSLLGLFGFGRRQRTS